MIPIPVSELNYLAFWRLCRGVIQIRKVFHGNILLLKQVHMNSGYYTVSIAMMTVERWFSLFYGFYGY